ncbi:MAG: helix-turn-helix domain-containing protein [Culicoidibacterales bacterium]
MNYYNEKIRFRKNLKSLRLKRDLSQSQLEINGDLPLGVVSQFENGSRCPGIENFLKLCYGLNCTPNDLLLENIYHKV